jgi:hypothetical protein
MFCGFVGSYAFISNVSGTNHSQKWRAMVHYGVRQFVRQRHSSADLAADRLITNTALHSDHDDTFRIFGFAVGPSHLCVIDDKKN